MEEQDLHDPVLLEAVRSLHKFGPKSVFLYGSRGRGDATPESDYELGVVFDDEKYVHRAEVHAAISDPQVKAYPFRWGELSEGTLDFLFQKSIYLREIIQGGRTIAGEDLIAHIQPLPITTLDLMQRVRFDIGMALAAVLSFRAGDKPTSMDEFSKSCFFGLRCLEILKLKTFPLGYEQIYDLSAKLEVQPRHRAVIEAAREFRKTGETAKTDLLYDNISLLDSLVEPELVAAFNEHGNKAII